VRVDGGDSLAALAGQLFEVLSPILYQLDKLRCVGADSDDIFGERLCLLLL
jgi:hypothetical protein